MIMMPLPSKKIHQERIQIFLSRFLPSIFLSLLLVIGVLFWPSDIGLGDFHSWRQGLPKPSIPDNAGKTGWITSAYGNDTGYRRMLLALAGSFRGMGGDGPLLVLDDGSVDAAYRKILEEAGCKIVTVDPVHVPERVAKTLDEPRHLPNFVRLRLWNLTEYSRLIFIDSDMLFVRDVGAIRNLPCNSAVPQRRGTINGGLMVVCPEEKIANAMLRKLEKGGRYPVAEQTFISNFFWGRWNYISTCLNARASDYRPWFKSFVRRHVFFWPKRDICKLSDIVLLHYNGAAKPWSINANRHYSPEMLRLYSQAIDKHGRYL